MFRMLCRGFIPISVQAVTSWPGEEMCIHYVKLMLSPRFSDTYITNAFQLQRQLAHLYIKINFKTFFIVAMKFVILHTLPPDFFSKLSFSEYEAALI